MMYGIQSPLYTESERVRDLPVSNYAFLVPRNAPSVVCAELSNMAHPNTFIAYLTRYLFGLGEGDQ
jgi:hypothetical protein